MTSGLGSSLAGAVTLSWGWPRRLIALAAGAFGALALAPFGLTLAMVVPMTIAVWLLDGALSLGAAFAVGWWWGLGYFVAGLWWLGAAFLVDADRYLWALPLGVLGLPMLLALFPALGFALARLIWPHGVLRPLALGAGLTASEILRANALSGFPWNEYGMALGSQLWPAQIAAYVGLHGLTLITVILAAAPATWPQGLRPSMLAALAAAALTGWGALRVEGPKPDIVAGVRVRLMQPNIAQGADFAPQNGAAILGRYLKLSDRATSPDRTGVNDVTHLFWPESAFPFLLNEDRGALARLAEFLNGGAILITGAARGEADGKSMRYFNAIEVVSSAGLSAERYDKHWLVPFGEYLPFRAVLERWHISQFVQAPGGFSPGVGPRSLKIQGLPPALPMLCYEAIFPNETPMRTGESANAGFILNLTDDAWFGKTAGPYQHLAQARLRAVELGVPMLRIANSGISAIIDSRGKILEDTSLGSEALIDSPLPGALAPTWQARFGLLTAALLTALAALVSLAGRFSRGIT